MLVKLEYTTFDLEFCDLFLLWTSEKPFTKKKLSRAKLLNSIYICFPKLSQIYRDKKKHIRRN